MTHTRPAQAITAEQVAQLVMHDDYTPSLPLIIERTRQGNPIPDMSADDVRAALRALKARIAIAERALCNLPVKGRDDGMYTISDVAVHHGKFDLTEPSYEPHALREAREASKLWPGRAYGVFANISDAAPIAVFMLGRRWVEIGS